MILTHMQKLSMWHGSQLTKKFQSAHFVASHGKGFKFYSKLACLDRDFVDPGDIFVSNIV